MVARTAVSPTSQSDEPEPVFPRWDATARNVIPFIDLAAQRSRLGDRIETAIARVLEHGEYILGPEVFAFEDRLSRFCGAHHAVSCASGTDALVLAQVALGVVPGDAVFTPSFTFAATAESVVLAGGTPVFVDVRADTFNLDVDSLRQAVRVATESGLRPRGVVAVDLYGQPADYDALADIADEKGLWVLADAAQSFGASLNGRRTGSLARATATSFYPAKPLGCYGDGGAVLTDDDALAKTITSLRTHGQEGDDRFHHVRIGFNSRLDSLQAAILLEKLEIFEEELALRAGVARRYAEGLAGAFDPPAVIAGATPAWAQYTLTVENRDRLAEVLRSAGVPTAIYYPRPLHSEPAFSKVPRAGEMRTAEQLATTVLSLPMHPYLDARTQERVVSEVHRATRAIRSSPPSR